MSITSEAGLEMIADVVEAHLLQHRCCPAIVWASEDLHRAVVLDLPSIMPGGVTVCRSHSLRGIAACAIFTGPGEAERPGHSGRMPAQSAGLSCDGGTASRPWGPVDR
jgi:hypothetical protein